MWNSPGQVITPTILAPTVVEALTNSLTPLNITSGFKKCGIHPPNPGKVKDRQLAPSKAVHFKHPDSTPADVTKPKCPSADTSESMLLGASQPKVTTPDVELTTTDVEPTTPDMELTSTGSIASTCTTGSATESRHWSPETIVLYQKRFEEGYELEGLDPDYSAWLKSGWPSRHR